MTVFVQSLFKQKPTVMNPILRNILAVIAGIIVGMAVNMGIVILSGSIIPLPDGVDASNPESLKAGMHLFETKHFIFPFLAHAIGTLAGALTAAKIAVNDYMKFALGIGVFFLIGGIANASMIGLPAWFTAIDLTAAYIPMGWLGGKLMMKD